jgi:hypothetical protein
MRIYLTQHQVNVMNTLINGGKVMSYPEGHYLIDAKGNNEYTRKDTLTKLMRMGWIKEQKNVPVPEVSTWRITKEGEQIMSENTITTPSYVRSRP